MNHSPMVRQISYRLLSIRSCAARCLTFVLLALWGSAQLGFAQGGSAQASDISFENDVLPILEDNCMYCHGEDEQESGFRLDRRAFMLRGGDSGLAAVVPEHPEKSYLIDVIRHVDQDMAMPPDEEKLADEDFRSNP